MRVGVNTGRAPLAGMSGNKIVGIDVDVAAAIADSLGLKLSIVDTGSDPEGALKDGSVDIVLGIDKSSTDGSFWKSDSYLPTGIALFAMSENAAVPTATTGAKFAAQVSSTSAWAVMNEFGDTSLTSTSSPKEAFAALSSGQCNTLPPTRSSASTMRTGRTSTRALSRSCSSRVAIASVCSIATRT